MNEQIKLPRPTKGLTFKVRINNITVFLHTGEYEDGTLGEIFIDMYKEGAGYKAILANFAITVSWLLQYGVPLDRLVDKFIYSRFEPAGVVTGDADIKMCSSVIDWIFRRLGITYLNMDLGNVKKETDNALLRHEMLVKEMKGEDVGLSKEEAKAIWGEEPIDIEIEEPEYLVKGELPKFVEELPVKNMRERDSIKALSKENKSEIQVYMLASGSLGLRPTGYKAKEFLKYCRVHKMRHNMVTDEKFELDFNADSLVIYDKASNGERDTGELKYLWFQFYGEKLDLGDI